MASWTVGISMGFDDDLHGPDASHNQKTSNFHCVFDLVVIPLEEGTSFVWVGFSVSQQFHLLLFIFGEAFVF